MTWYAHDVFADPRPGVIESLRELFPGCVHHVPHLEDFRRRRREVFAVEFTGDGTRELERDVIEGPELAPGGLVVVRGLCEAGSHADEWYGADTGRAWNHTAGNSDSAILPPSAVFTGEQAFLLREVTSPPSQLLGALRALNRRTGAVVSLFCAHTWGGDLEYAFAWVFDGRWNNDRVYLHVAQGPGRRVHAWSQLQSERPRVIAGGDVLTLVLVHHGVLLRDRYFEPHTRSFPWDRYRV